MLKLYIGNKLDKLLFYLSDNIKKTSSPLKKTSVCVQTAGMQRWIGLSLAEMNGISANLDFMFPSALIKRMAEKHYNKKELWTEKEKLVWLVFDSLLKLRETPYTKSITEYLKNDPQKIKAFRLAGRIADVFDQYQLYRPEMVLRWLNQKADREDEKWQAELFRKVFPDKYRCKTQILDDMIKTMTPDSFRGMDTVQIFGISVIPPFFTDVFVQAGKYIDINMYLLSPTQHYWGDSISEREISRMEKITGKTAEQLLLLQNHPLLDNLGMLGRDFFDILIDRTGEENTEHIFEAPVAKNRLTVIQSEIFSLAPSDAATPENDASVTVASCHNPMRETEALYDYLLNLFNGDKDLKPSDILVMCTDIQSYAPYIRAVFDNPCSANAQIPYSIADIPVRQTSRPAAVLTEILSLLTGDFSLTAVIKAVSDRLVADKFGIKRPENLASVLKNNHALFGLTPSDIETTADTPFIFERAMKRIALGLAEGDSGYIYAEPSGENVPFSLAEDLGGFMRFVNVCGDFREMLKTEDTPQNLCGLLSDVIDNFLSETTEFSDDFVFLASSVAKIRELCSFCTIKMSYRPVFELFSSILENTSGTKGFITGKTTFCAMLPMRSIPFRVICILGLNDSSFPRQKTELEFDLMSRPPKQKGDRNQRESDKYLFLETIISAGERLYLSYTGRQESDNKEIMPSILVTELLRHLNTRFGSAEIKNHRLHSFSREYFKNNGLYTFRPDRYEAARLFEYKKQPLSFCPNELNPEMPSSAELSEFERFFTDPASYFLKSTLGISAALKTDTLPSTEVMNLDTLYRYKFREDIFQSLLTGKNPDVRLSYALKSGRLPSGGLGKHYADETLNYSHTLINAAQKHLNGEYGYTDITYLCGSFSVSGRIHGTSGDSHVFIKTGYLTAKDVVRVRIRHLFLNHLRPTETLVISSENEFTLPPSDSAEALDTLVSVFLNGLKKPVCFLPEAGRKYLHENGRKIPFMKEDEFNSAESSPAFLICFGSEYKEDEMAKLSELFFGTLTAEGANEQ